MANCTATEVRLIIQTGMIDDDIDQLITLSDQEITDLGFDALETNTKKNLSMHFTAAKIALHDSTSTSIGEYSESKLNAAGWEQIKNDLIARYLPGGDSGAGTGGTFEVITEPEDDDE